MAAMALQHQEGSPDIQHMGTCPAYELVTLSSSIGSSSADMEGGAMDEVISLEGPHDRLLGDTEENWCRAVAGGTGITVIGVLFSQHLDSSKLQLAIDVVQLKHPRLRSELIWIHGKPAFRVSSKPRVKVQVLDATRSEDASSLVTGFEHVQTAEDGNAEQPEKSKEDERTWLTLVEAELNTNLWPEKEHSLEPVQMFAIRLHYLPGNRSLVTLRVHTAACDRVSAATVLTDILETLLKISRGLLPLDSETPHNAEADTSRGLKDEIPSGRGKEDNSSVELMSVEAAIPPGKGNKPFWAHGIDLLGYSLVSRWHALLPFKEPCMPRRTRLIRSSLGFEHTQALLQACSDAKASLYGAICAAGLKAAAASKQLGNNSEHFAIVTLVDCRHYLEPVLADSTVGFYHSALMSTHHLNETTKFWELVRCCSDSLDNAIKNQKHFTDIGDLNYLMYQSMMHPNLMPSNSLRTSLLVVFRDTLSDNFADLADALGVEDYVGCSSIHGIGPSLAVFDCIRNGQLHCANVYPSPLHSRSQMQTFVNTMMDNLVKFNP